MKSFIAVYIAAKTPRRERIIVKTWVCHPVSLSSFTPPQTVSRIIPIIWNAIPEYLEKSFRPLFWRFFWFLFFDGSCSSIIICITHFAISWKNCSRFNRKFWSNYITIDFWWNFQIKQLPDSYFAFDNSWHFRILANNFPFYFSGWTNNNFPLCVKISRKRSIDTDITTGFDVTGYICSITYQVNGCVIWFIELCNNI